jgi:hypothetical protein
MPFSLKKCVVKSVLKRGLKEVYNFCPLTVVANVFEALKRL